MSDELMYSFMTGTRDCIHSQSACFIDDLNGNKGKGITY